MYDQTRNAVFDVTEEQAPSRQPIVLEMRNITKRFGAFTANDAINLHLKAGDVVALLGENGAGKTTLMNILFGHYVADEGDIRVRNPHGDLIPLNPGSPQDALDAGIGMVHQHFTLTENLTGFENIMLGIERPFAIFRRLRAARAKLDDLMERSGLYVDLDVRIRTMTVGEKQRIEILKALYREVRILVLDEPTAVLTPQESDGLYKTVAMLADQGLAVIFISHKLHEVLAASHRITVLRHGKVVGELITEQADHKQIAELMVDRDIPPSIREAHDLGEPVLELDNVHVDGLDARRTLHGVDMAVRSGEIIGIAGVAGNGQTALAGLISGLTGLTSGDIRFIGEPVVQCTPATFMERGIGRIPEDRHHDGVVGSMSIAENLVIENLGNPRFQTKGFLNFTAIRAYADQVIRHYDVRCSGPDGETRLLSGGNMQKLILARVLDREPRLILANQPTCGLDIGAQTDVYHRLLAARKRGAGIVLISENLDELFTLADRIFVIHEGYLREAGPTDTLDRSRVGMMMGGHADHSQSQRHEGA